MGYIEFRENNSGGDFWLSAEDYDNLKAAGWEGEGVLPNRYEGRCLRRHGVSIRMAKAEFYDITGQDPDEEGCDCCGQPFPFYRYDDEGKMIW